jgi:hypothetical protein
MKTEIKLGCVVTAKSFSADHNEIVIGTIAGESGSIPVTAEFYNQLRLRDQIDLVATIDIDGRLCECDPARTSYAFNPTKNQFVCRTCGLIFKGHQ